MSSYLLEFAREQIAAVYKALLAWQINLRFPCSNSSAELFVSGNLAFCQRSFCSLKNYVIKFCVESLSIMKRNFITTLTLFEIEQVFVALDQISQIVELARSAQQAQELFQSELVSNDPIQGVLTHEQSICVAKVENKLDHMLVCVVHIEFVDKRFNILVECQL
jgi:hypothetical protein